LLRRLALAVVAALSLGAAPAHAAGVPTSFFGVMADGPLLSARVDLGSEVAAMQAAHVGSMRVAFYWSSIQPYRHMSDVPARSRRNYVEIDGVPTNLGQTDHVVLSAARRGISVLPVVVRTPKWAARNGKLVGSPPRYPEAYGRFLTALIGRYGPQGTLWSGHPDVAPVPIRSWQVWNEPDIFKYWADTSFAPGYVALLRAARDAIKAADPDAQVVAAGLTNRSWEDLDQLYAAGADDLFDVAAIHPFSRRVANVLKLAELARGVMDKHGDAEKPLLLSEVSWSSGRGHSRHNYGWETTEKGQADRVRQVLTALANARERLHLAGLYWYTWLSRRPGGRDSFDYAGLRRLSADGRTAIAKPALAAWRTTVARLTTQR
jgi:hypothetical protein